MKKTAALLISLSASLLAAAPALAQNTTPPATGPTLDVPARAMPSDEQSYRSEVVYGINFNTQGGLIGGVNLRVAKVVDERWLRFWSLEGVAFKNPKEERLTNPYGGTFTRYKTNYALALRPSYGVQRILFRKAPDSGVQVNGLLSAGPSIGILMPYYVTYDFTWANRGGNTIGANDDIRDVQFDPSQHNSNYIIDRAPLFSGISQTTFVPGGHIRGGLSFEYGRYRDAVAGVEVGFVAELYAKRLNVLSTGNPDEFNALNQNFYPSVYLTLYIGHRN